MYIVYIYISYIYIYIQYIYFDHCCIYNVGALWSIYLTSHFKIHPRPCTAMYINLRKLSTERISLILS